MAATVVQDEDERVRLAKAFPGFSRLLQFFFSRFSMFFFFMFSRLSTFLPLQGTSEQLILELTWFKYLN